MRTHDYEDDEILYLDLTSEQLVMTDGQAIPVSNWFDQESKDCGPFEAVSGVAGPTPWNGWLAFLVSDFTERPVLH